MAQAQAMPSEAASAEAVHGGPDSEEELTPLWQNATHIGVELPGMRNCLRVLQSGEETVGERPTAIADETIPTTFYVERAQGRSVREARSPSSGMDRYRPAVHRCVQLHSLSHAVALRWSTDEHHDDYFPDGQHRAALGVRMRRGMVLRSRLPYVSTPWARRTMAPHAPRLNPHGRPRSPIQAVLSSCCLANLSGCVAQIAQVL